MNGYFLLSVESRLEACLDKREAQISTWINVTKQRAKEKTIDEHAGVLLIGRFFASILTTQFTKCCAERGKVSKKKDLQQNSELGLS